MKNPKKKKSEGGTLVVRDSRIDIDRVVVYVYTLRISIKGSFYWILVSFIAYLRR